MLETNFIKIDNTKRHSRILTKVLCPNCKNFEVVKLSNKWVNACGLCGSMVSFFDPSEQQLLVIQDMTSFIKLNIGGMGSAKTLADCEFIANHVRMFPNAHVGMKAQTEAQLKQSAKKELERFFLEEEFQTKNVNIWILKNGSQISFLTGDEQSLRSLNFSVSWAIEASGMSKALIDELMHRTRANVGNEYETDEFGNVMYKTDAFGQQRPVISKSYNQVIIESNPGPGLIRDMVLQSSSIFYTPNVKGIDFLKQRAKPVTLDSENINSYLSSSVDNVHVTEKWLDQAFAGQSKEMSDIQKFCDLSYNLGLIYPNYRNAIVEPFGIPDNWPWLMGLDPGTEAYDGLLWARLDPENGVFYFVEESAERFQDYKQTLQTIKKIEEDLELNPKGLLYRVIDTAANAKSKNDGKSGVDILYQEGRLDFVPAQKTITEGINYFKTGINDGRVKIFSSLKFFINELENYHYADTKEYEVADLKPAPNQDDHLSDIARYMWMNMKMENGRIAPLIKKSYHNVEFGNLDKVMQRLLVHKNLGSHALDLRRDNWILDYQEAEPEPEEFFVSESFDF